MDLFQTFDLSILKNLTPSTERFKVFGLEQIKKLSYWYKISHEGASKGWMHFKNLVLGYKVNNLLSAPLRKMIISFLEKQSLHFNQAY